MQQNLQQKKGFVKSVFNKVFDKYDLMNDLMSFGTHRIWKKKLISWMNPLNNAKIVDVASGTGDVAKLCLNYTNNNKIIQKTRGIYIYSSACLRIFFNLVVIIVLTSLVNPCLYKVYKLKDAYINHIID